MFALNCLCGSPTGCVIYKPVGGQQLLVDGHIFAIGNDWLVRFGNVILAGGAIKGMLLEVSSYITLRLPVSHFI